MFQGEPSFRYGNIADMTPEQVADTALFGGIEDREKKVLDECARCAFFDLCYSGCMFHSLTGSGVLAEKDYYCADCKMYFEHVLRRVHADLLEADRVNSQIRSGRMPTPKAAESRVVARKSQETV